MSSQEEFLTALPRLLETPCPPISIVAFDPLAFDNPGSEESIIIHRGQRVGFDNILHFWVKSVQSQDWQGREPYMLRYLQSGKCCPMTEIEFNNLVARYSARLKQPLSLPLHSEAGFVGAMQMDDDWCNVAAVAEYEDEFIAFYWETTA